MSCNDNSLKIWGIASDIQNMQLLSPCLGAISNTPQIMILHGPLSIFSFSSFPPPPVRNRLEAPIRQLLFPKLPILHLAFSFGELLAQSFFSVPGALTPVVHLGLIHCPVGRIQLHQPLQIPLGPVPLGEVGEGCPSPEQLHISRLLVCAVDRPISGLVQPTPARPAQPEVAECSSDGQPLTQRIPLGKLHRPAAAPDGLCRLPGIFPLQAQLRHFRFGQQSQLVLRCQSLWQPEQRGPLQELHCLLTYGRDEFSCYRRIRW